jgi:sarcosine oxidase
MANMATRTFDVAIIGAGAMGSASTYHLSRSGKKIIVLDRFHPPHGLGSSHGKSRIIREAYFESPMYVPLVQQAYMLWDEMEKESGKKLFLKTGGLMIGSRDQKVFSGASASAAQHHIAYEYLDGEAIKRRFPVFNPTYDTVALLEKNAGILFPEACIETQISLAEKADVEFHFDERVQTIISKSGKVEISTDKETYTATKVIVAAGAWMATLFPELHLPLEVKRQVLFWFRSTEGDSNKFLPENLPVYIWEYEKNKIFYGFPDLGEGMKIAIHHRGKLATPDAIDRRVGVEEIKEIDELLKRYFTSTFTYHYSDVCMYTNTPDEDFIIDFHPDDKNIILASPCSGHGFKFSSAIGKILSQMALGEKPGFDISVFSLDRF